MAYMKKKTSGTKKPMLSIWTKQYVVESSYVVQLSDISCNILAEVLVFNLRFS
jgi:hypothetical protein